MRVVIDAKVAHVPVIDDNKESQNIIDSPKLESDTIVGGGKTQGYTQQENIEQNSFSPAHSPQGITDSLVMHEIKLAEKQASIDSMMKELENKREHMEIDRQEFLARRKDFAVVKAEVEAHRTRLQEEEKSLREAKEKVDHDMIWIDVQKEKIEKELEDIAHLKAEPNVQVVTHEGALASQKAANIKKQLTSKDKADMMIAAADKMVDDVEKQKEIFQEEMNKELTKLRSEKQVIAREKIAHMKFKAELLKRENGITKDRAALDAEREKFDIDVKAWEDKAKAEKDAFEAYRAKEEKKLAEDIDLHSGTKSAASKEVDGVVKTGARSKLSAMLKAASGASGAASTAIQARASPVTEVQVSNALSETLSATHLVAKLAMKRKKNTEEKKRKEEVDATVETRVKEEVEVRLAKALAMTQKDQIEVGVQTMVFSTKIDSASMDTSRSHLSSNANEVDATVHAPLLEAGETEVTNDISLSTPSLFPVPPIAPASNELESHFENDEMLRQHKYLGMQLLDRGNSGPLLPSPVLPPGFHLVFCEDSVLELCPGVTYASFGLLETWELEKVPHHILYARRATGEAFSRGIRRLPRYVPCPRIKACEAVILPDEGLDVAPGVKLIINSSPTSVNMELPLDVHVAAVDVNAKLPPGMTRVDLHPSFNVAHTTFTAPKGLGLGSM